MLQSIEYLGGKKKVYSTKQVFYVKNTKNHLVENSFY